MHNNPVVTLELQRSYMDTSTVNQDNLTGRVIRDKGQMNRIVSRQTEQKFKTFVHPFNRTVTLG